MWPHYLPALAAPPGALRLPFLCTVIPLAVSYSA